MCICLGMVAALRISFDREQISYEQLSKTIKLIKEFNIPTSEKSLNIDKIYDYTLSDKKMDSGIIKFILLEDIGKAQITKTVTKTEIKNAIKSLSNGE